MIKSIQAYEIKDSSSSYLLDGYYILQIDKGGSKAYRRIQFQDQDDNFIRYFQRRSKDTLILKNSTLFASQKVEMDVNCNDLSRRYIDYRKKQRKPTCLGSMSLIASFLQLRTLSYYTHFKEYKNYFDIVEGYRKKFIELENFASQITSSIKSKLLDKIEQKLCEKTQKQSEQNSQKNAIFFKYLPNFYNKIPESYFGQVIKAPTQKIFNFVKDKGENFFSYSKWKVKPILEFLKQSLIYKNITGEINELVQGIIQCQQEIKKKEDHFIKDPDLFIQKMKKYGIILNQAYFYLNYTLEMVGNMFKISYAKSKSEILQQSLPILLDITKIVFPILSKSYLINLPYISQISSILVRL